MTSPSAVTIDALARAHAAIRPARSATPIDRARVLRAIADALDEAAVDLIPQAQGETHLTQPRLTGELARTSFQARLFAERLESGALAKTRIDHADLDWPMGQRPDIRRTHVPIGPVLVFAASNFPFAFSVAGGDTVSALAAGCPVVVKAHPGHAELSRRTAAIVQDALARVGAPDGLFGLIEGERAGVDAVKDSRIKAVGFTGSLRGGRALFDIAMSRQDPIPFYGELGSTNPVVVTPEGWATRPTEIATGFIDSLGLGSGQFCTKPGVVFVPDVDAFIHQMSAPRAGRMLNDRIRQGFDQRLADLSSKPGVEVAARWPASPGGPTPTVLRTTINAVHNAPDLIQTECFGPAAIVCGYDDLASVLSVLDNFGGTLTGTVQGGQEVDEDATRVLDALAEHAGRVIWNQWPTGVTVSDAQQHGGPWPATTCPTATSVGTAAIERFLRPIAFQNVPQGALPTELRD